MRRLFRSINNNEMPHMFIGGPDTSFTEDISLISYTVGAGFFGMSKFEQTQWLSKYSSINDKDERMAMLRKNIRKPFCPAHWCR